MTMGNMKALLYPILKELTVWTEGNRAASARLLRTCLVYSEAKITRNVHRIVPVLVKVIHAANANVANRDVWGFG